MVDIGLKPKSFTVAVLSIPAARNGSDGDSKSIDSDTNFKSIQDQRTTILVRSFGTLGLSLYSRNLGRNFNQNLYCFSLAETTWPVCQVGLGVAFSLPGNETTNKADTFASLRQAVAFHLVGGGGGMGGWGEGGGGGQNCSQTIINPCA